jgi:hypothetical protein
MVIKLIDLVFKYIKSIIKCDAVHRIYGFSIFRAYYQTITIYGDY